MDIKQNYFEFLGLPVGFSIDLGELASRYRELQKTLHPDRFAHLSDQEQRMSVQYTAYLNQAASTLRAPLSRAQYLLLLKGIDTFAESSVKLDPVFLFEQMSLRENLEELGASADPERELEKLAEDVESQIAALEADFASFYSLGDEQALEAAAVVVRKLQFMMKLLKEIELAQDALD